MSRLNEERGEDIKLMHSDYTSLLSSVYSRL
jgi:hypothetical protein